MIPISVSIGSLGGSLSFHDGTCFAGFFDSGSGVGLGVQVKPSGYIILLGWVYAEDNGRRLYQFLQDALLYQSLKK
jgi:hypothetical protein